jgi:hypothetical protein
VRKPPSWWWFLAPAVLTILAVIIGAGAIASLLHTNDARYGEVRADGEPHAISIPTKDRAMLMIPSLMSSRDAWTCKVTDSRGAALPTRTGGTVSFSDESEGWQSLLTFDPADAGTGRTVTVYVACRTSDVDIDGAAGNVLVIKEPRVGAIVARVLALILGPLILGGAAFIWFIVLVVLQVTRRTGAAT